MLVKEKRRGRTTIAANATSKGWYIIVGTKAVCSHHAPVHLHGSADREHPDHQPKVAVDPTLTLGEALRRVRDLCERLDREPEMDELREALR